MREMFDCNSVIDQLTFPMARRALSKNSIIPKKRKNTPNPVSPIPISVINKTVITTDTVCGDMTCHKLSFPRRNLAAADNNRVQHIRKEDGKLYLLTHTNETHLNKIKKSAWINVLKMCITVCMRSVLFSIQLNEEKSGAT